MQQQEVNKLEQSLIRLPTIGKLVIRVNAEENDTVSVSVHGEGSCQADSKRSRSEGETKYMSSYYKLE